MAGEAEQTAKILNAPYKFGYGTEHLKPEDRPFFGESYRGYTADEEDALKAIVERAVPYATYRDKVFSDENAAAVLDALDPRGETGLASVWHFPASSPLFIDIGPGKTAKPTMRSLLEMGMRVNTPVRMYLSHPHFDHYGTFEPFFALFNVEQLYYSDYTYKDPLRWVYFQRYVLGDAGGMNAGLDEFFAKYDDLFVQMKRLKDKDYKQAMQMYYEFVKTPYFIEQQAALGRQFSNKGFAKLAAGSRIETGDPNTTMDVAFTDLNAENPNNASIILYVEVKTDGGIVRGLITGDSEGTDDYGHRWTGTALGYDYKKSGEYNTLKYLVDKHPEVFAEQGGGLDFLQAPHHGSRNGAFNLFFHKAYTSAKDRATILKRIMEDLKAEWSAANISTADIKKRLVAASSLNLGNLLKSGRKSVVFTSTGDTSYSGTQHPYVDAVDNFRNISNFYLLEAFPEPYVLVRSGDQATKLSSLAAKQGVTKEALVKALWALKNEDPYGKASKNSLLDLSNTSDATAVERIVEDFLHGSVPLAPREAEQRARTLIDAMLRMTRDKPRTLEELAGMLRDAFNQGMLPYGTDEFAKRFAGAFLKDGCSSADACMRDLGETFQRLLSELHSFLAVGKFVEDTRGYVVSKCRYIENKQQDNLRIVIRKDGSVAAKGGVAIPPSTFIGTSAD